MIASQEKGKSFMGALFYNLRKTNHPDVNQRAKLLDTNFGEITLKQVKKEIDLVRELRPNLNKYVYHTSLNFSLADEPFLSDEKLLAIAHDYLQANGFNNNQYLIFRHHDAGHPHLHLLVNRIRFDGSVVSDSNDYKRSEEVVRELERTYNLTSVTSSRESSQRAAKKDEIEMVVRSGKPSTKMVLQEKLNQLINQKNIDLQTLIKLGEARGINFLFNVASTERVSGITYFEDGFKITGKVLGNQFKWGEIIKRVNYEQVRDSEAVSEANSRTTEKYGELSSIGTYATPKRQRRSGSNLVSQNPGTTVSEFRRNEIKDGTSSERSLDANKDVDFLPNGANDFNHYQPNNFTGIQISDDIDDEAIHGRNRHRKKQARMNTR